MAPSDERWLRVTVETDAAQEDYVSDLLNDAAGGRGVEVLDRRAALLAPEAAILSPGRVLIRAYVPVGEYRADRFDVTGIPRTVAHEVAPVDEDWRENWKRFFKATRIGQRIVVRPPWEDLPDRRASDIDLIIEPGMAFGTGTHETTRLCLEQLDNLELPGTRIFDVGCGSGVLAIAAIKLGATSVRAIDIDQAAIDATIENAERNSVSGVEASVTPLEDVDGTFDLVVANILASVLVSLRDDLIARVRPGGTLILSGILESEAEEVAQIFEAAGPVRSDLVREREWVAIRFAIPV